MSKEFKPKQPIHSPLEKEAKLIQAAKEETNQLETKAPIQSTISKKIADLLQNDPEKQNLF